jgi:hypothetical protein
VTSAKNRSLRLSVLQNISWLTQVRSATRVKCAETETKTETEVAALSAGYSLNQLCRRGSPAGGRIHDLSRQSSEGKGGEKDHGSTTPAGARSPPRGRGAGSTTGGREKRTSSAISPPKGRGWPPGPRSRATTRALHYASHVLNKWDTRNKWF